MLFEALNFAGLATKNRVVMPAIHQGFSERGFVNKRTEAFYEARAAGGAGMIFTGGTAVLAGDSQAGMLSIHSDEHIPGHCRLAQTIKKHGALAGIQLFHPGRYSSAYKAGFEIVAPSAVASRLNGQMPRALETEEVYQCAENIAICARRAREAGYDLAEVIMSAGYLVSQFLSPLTNLREDEFGGDFPARMRFPLLIIDRIKALAGADFPISVRLGAQDFMPGGNGLEDTSLLAAKLEEHGISMINVTGGWHEAPVPQLASIVPRGGYVFLAAAIKNCVSVPVVASNRINDPVLAEKILQLGQADLITVARGHLADPDWVNKAQAGRAGSIRKCIGCMACMDSLFEQGEMICAINPECGREGEAVGPDARPNSPQAMAAASHTSLLVIGAGPAGLEAACRAARKGYAVTLAEAGERIGGQWNLALVPPGKSEFRSLLDYYEDEPQNLQVTVLLNRPIAPGDLDQFPEGPVIVATGARPFRPEIPLSGDCEVVHAWEVLAGRLPKGPDVIVVGGGSTGCETAVHLAEQGTIDSETLRFLMLYQALTPDKLGQLLTRGAYRVKVVEMQDRLASDMGLASRWPLLTHLRHLGIEPLTGHRVREIRTNAVVTEDHDNCEHWHNANSVVLALGSRPEDSLYNQIKNRRERVYLLGDALAPARLQNAIHSAYCLIEAEF